MRASLAHACRNLKDNTPLHKAVDFGDVKLPLALCVCVSASHKQTGARTYEHEHNHARTHARTCTHTFNLLDLDSWFTGILALCVCVVLLRLLTQLCLSVLALCVW